MTSATHGVNIKSLVPITLDMQSHCYRRWRNLFHIVLGRFNLRHHVDVNNPLPNDPTWAQEDLTVLMWIHATLGDDLMDMVMEPNPTAFSAWDKIRNFFTDNKPSRAVHLEAEFHGLKQGDLSASAYCHKLKTLADALADCDQPVGDRALVHQLIRGLNREKFGTMKTLLPVLPQFPTFMQARSYLIMEENSYAESNPPSSTDTALVATDGATSSNDSPGARHDSGSRGSSNNSNRGCRGRGGGRGRGRGRGGGGRGQNNGGNNGGSGNNQQYWVPPYYPWSAPYNTGSWRAPWTGATGPGVLGRGPSNNAAGQAFPAFQQPSTMPAPVAAPSWDTNSLIAALHTASLQQPSGDGG